MTWPPQDGDQYQNPSSPPPYGQQPPPYGQEPPQYSQQPPQSGQQPPPPYGQPPYPGYGQPYPPAAPGTNVMAILSLVFAFVFSPAGIVLGHIAKRQLKTSGESGDGLATAGLVLSYIFAGIGLLLCCGTVVLAITSNSSS